MTDDELIEQYADEILEGRADAEALATGTWARRTELDESVVVVEDVDGLPF